MKELTKRQYQVYEFIKNFIDNNKYSPSYREVAEYFEIDVRAAMCHIMALIKKGYLKSEKGKSRTLQIIER